MITLIKKSQNIVGKTSLLVIDDKSADLYVLRELIRENLPDCEVVFATSAEDGLVLASRRSFDGILLEVNLPGMDGIQMCRRLKATEYSANIPIILMTASDATPELKAEGMDSGADDFIQKPVSDIELIAKIKVILRLKYAEDQLRELNSEILRKYLDLFKKIVEVLANAIEARDKYTRGHIERVTKYTIAIGQKLGWDKSKLHHAYVGSLLHDIGKIGIPDSILNKPGSLTSQEYALLKKHTVIGVRIIEDVDLLKDMVHYIYYHHERFDGNGYPRGLKGKEIPIEGRVVAVADSYDAMTSTRAYRKSLSVLEAKNRLKSCSGSQFDPDIVNVFLDVLDKAG